MRVNADDLTGRKVYDRAGKTIGEVNTVEIDSTTWNVTGIRIDVDKDAANELGVERPVMGKSAVVFGAERIEAVGDVVTLRDSLEELRSAIRQTPKES